MSREAVVGIGRVGLPLALYPADHEHRVVGLDQVFCELLQGLEVS